MGALVRSEFLNGISKHCAGHLQAVLVEEICQSVFIALADFAEHPADGLLHEVMPCVKKHSCKIHRVTELFVPYEGQGGNDRYPLLPHIVRSGQRIQDLPVRRPSQMASENRWSGKVDQVPVVDPFRMTQIETDCLFRLFLISFHQNKQCTQPAFMPFAFQQRLNDLPRH